MFSETGLGWVVQLTSAYYLWPLETTLCAYL
jgi:hypothetical protein